MVVAVVVVVALANSKFGADPVDYFVAVEENGVVEQPCWAEQLFWVEISGIVVVGQLCLPALIVGLSFSALPSARSRRFTGCWWY